MKKIGGTVRTGVTLTRYGYDKEKGKCVRFLYGGCGMNHNNFRRLKECNQFCKAEKAYNKKKKT
ncbi:Kunitz/Bovine pancreatic trypsin inhibitor domain protein [Necator americanus]|uniref:Kunitz/Bovine pancreatic trypsin inhibitor domain protein n=1 Tax=Necator americanus TaxID=51031 RepID=W2SIT4_NECAM|nr:Kunitz/Bovine pancreatic trypsin inhibitor domain protein [Necator americanus]ETN69569.1 Kunitz/Bovine pancreatic trypsin inhibitor domain protein [Necator americanus]